MNRRWIIFGGSSALIIVAVLIVFTVISKQHKPEKTVDTFNEAIENNDIDSLKELIEPDEKDVEINKESLSALINYLKANNESYQVIKENFKKQINDEDFTSSKEQLNLFEDEKTMGIFQNYKFKVRTVNLQLKGEDDGDKVNLAVEGSNEALNKVDKEKDIYGPVLPGEYNIEATIMNKLGKFNKDEKVDVWGNADVSFLIDSEKLASENDNIQEDIINAANKFNGDMSAYVTSGFKMDEFKNVTKDFKDSIIPIDNEFDAIKEYVEKIESQFLEAVINMDELDLTQFDGDWQAEVTVLVAYNESVKLKGEKKEDLSYKELRNISLIYDQENEKWMVDDFTAELFDESKVDNWENKVEIEMDGSQNYEWSKEESFI